MTLTATNACGSDQMVRTNYITVTTPPCDAPVANFTGSPTSGTYPLNVIVHRSVDQLSDLVDLELW